MAADGAGILGPLCPSLSLLSSFTPSTKLQMTRVSDILQPLGVKKVRKQIYIGLLKLPFTFYLTPPSLI